MDLATPKRRGHRKSSSSASRVSLKSNRYSSSSLTKKGKMSGYTSDTDSDDGSSDSESKKSPKALQHQTSTVSTVSTTAPVTNVTNGKSRRKPPAEWCIIEGLRDGERVPEAPLKYYGYMRKRRKWPTKGWHKRYFFLEKGVLMYAKSPYDIQKGKYHGTIDIGMAVVAYKTRGRRIDIDAEENVYHVKVKNKKVFEEWISNIKLHRLFRQSELAYGSHDAPRLSELPSDGIAASSFEKLIASGSRDSVGGSGGLHPRNSLPRRPTALQRVQSIALGSWLSDNGSLDYINKEVMELQAKLFDLSTVMQQLEASVPVTPNSPTRRGFEHKGLTTQLPAMGTSRKSLRSRISFRRHKNKKPKDTENEPTDARSSLELPQEGVIRLTSSNPNLLIDMASGSDENTATANETRQEFCNLASNFHEQVRRLVRSLQTEKERWRRVVETNTIPLSNTDLSSFKQQNVELLKQNTELKTRLRRIMTECQVADLEPAPARSNVSSPSFDRTRVPSPAISETSLAPHPGILAPSLSLESPSEYFDAEEKVEELSDSDSTSEEEEEDEEEEEEEEDEGGQSEQSADVDIPQKAAALLRCDGPSKPYNNGGVSPMRFDTGRREKLPVHASPDSVPNMWSILKKYIGKDLSKVSMPVGLNEPLGFLQKLCEELEYTELLDKASTTADPYERMVQVAAFAVSGYTSMQTRADRKPFNPLLGETYECVRQDKGWKFMAEQVSHHPPVSALHCESPNFSFWQDVRVKTKFWGKSMEADSIGALHLVLPKFEEEYTWQKARTKCHNVFVGTKWIEHVGNVTITCSNKIVCKLTFSQAGYWSNKKHEVYGGVYDEAGRMIHRLFGRWTEGLYCGNPPAARCVWRPGSLPEDHELYYGFSRFTIELNELMASEEQSLPITDTRFRPDQRYMEEGDIEAADAAKVRLEQTQRDRRKALAGSGGTHCPHWFSKQTVAGAEQWIFNKEYWKLRENPTFKKVKLTPIFGHQGASTVESSV